MSRIANANRVRVSRDFGGSPRSFYTDCELDIEEACACCNPEIKRVVVEVCCGECSHISDKKNCEGDDCLCIRVTISDDLGREEPVRAIINVLKAYGGKVLLWFALPCTGGCPYARLNARKSAKARLRLGGRLSLF